MKLRVTQATLSRDIAELKLVKTAEGYKPLKPAHEDGTQALPPVAPGGAQPLAAAVDGERLREVAGTIGGDDTVLVITPSRAARTAVQQRLEAMLR